MIRVFMKNHGCHPFGNAKARAMVWNFPDAIPQHREPLYGTRPDLAAKYPTHDDKMAFWRLPTLYKSVQQQNIADKVAEKFPYIMTSGRLVEYEGGGEETRSNPWLAELQQEMFIEINPQGGGREGHPQRRARLGAHADRREAQRAGPGDRARRARTRCSCPSTSPATGRAADMLAYYPAGAHPIVRGEAINTGTTYGYDSVTMMQETKTTVCNVEKA